MSAPSEVTVTLTREEAHWLASAARWGADDTCVRGAGDELRALADKLTEAAGPYPPRILPSAEGFIAVIDAMTGR